MPQRQDGERRCVFCGALGKLSKEHLWSAWLQNLFEFPTETSLHGRFIRESGAELRGELWDMRAFEQQVTAPCERCNNEWMSRLETAVQPLLAPLIGGRSRVWLDPAAQATIATWGVKTAMMAQFVYPDRRSIRDPDYEWLYRHGAPPPNYRVWAGMRHADGGEWPAFFRHSALTVTPADREPEEADNTNAHRSTVSVGHLVIHVIGNYIEDGPVLDVEGTYNSAFARIWPATEGIEWPPKVILRMDAIRALTPSTEDTAPESDLERLLAIQRQS